MGGDRRVTAAVRGIEAVYDRVSELLLLMVQGSTRWHTHASEHVTAAMRDDSDATLSSL